MPGIKSQECVKSSLWSFLHHFPSHSSSVSLCWLLKIVDLHILIDFLLINKGVVDNWKYKSKEENQNHNTHDFGICSSFMGVSMCVCVCERERERERDYIKQLFPLVRWNYFVQSAAVYGNVYPILIYAFYSKGIATLSILCFVTVFPIQQLYFKSILLKWVFLL